jgi:hypothetical protein
MVPWDIEEELEENVQGSFRDLIGVLSRQPTWRIEENHGNHSQNSQYSGRGLNQASSE